MSEDVQPEVHPETPADVTEPTTIDIASLARLQKMQAAQESARKERLRSLMYTPFLDMTSDEQRDYFEAILNEEDIFPRGYLEKLHALRDILSSIDELPSEPSSVDLSMDFEEPHRLHEDIDERYGLADGAPVVQQLPVAHMTTYHRSGAKDGIRRAAKATEEE
jgi:hypothetical protein